MIAQTLRLYETSVVRYTENYLTSEKLTINSGGSDSYLTDKQTEELIEHLCDITYLYAYQKSRLILKKSMLLSIRYPDLINGYISIISAIKSPKVYLINFTKIGKPILLRFTSN
ncbi:MAG: hypothetical protein ACJASU_001423 [Cognaticolwellia sp.]|jgi:hypothetical protein